MKPSRLTAIRGGRDDGEDIPRGDARYAQIFAHDRDLGRGDARLCGPLAQRVDTDALLLRASKCDPVTRDSGFV
jgi:hypothetical protein